MEIRNLQTFLKVASAMNITRAAEALGYSQSNVSAQIQQLEEELGIRLFDRVGRGIVLTQYGKDLIPYAEQVLASIKALESCLRSDAELGGVLRLGFVESVFHAFGKDILLNFTKRFPNIKLQITVDSSTALKKLLLSDEIDVACIIDTELPNIKLACPYCRDVEVLMLVSKNHALADKRAAGRNELLSTNFVLMEDDAPYNILFQRLFHELKTEIIPVISLQSSEMARQLVEASDFATLLPAFVVAESLENKRIVSIKLEGEKIMQKVQILHAKNKFVTPQIKGYIQETENIFEHVLK